MHHAVTETLIQAHEAPTNAPAMLRVTVNENTIAKASVPNAPSVECGGLLTASRAVEALRWD